MEYWRINDKNQTVYNICNLCLPATSVNMVKHFCHPAIYPHAYDIIHAVADITNMFLYVNTVQVMEAVDYLPMVNINW